jgi:tetratricopeptide (TPR) repeat protein
MSYYQGLSYLQLKDKIKAKEIFDALVANGDKQLNPDSDNESDFFAIFGEKEDDNTLLSMAYTIRGLGYKGLGKKRLASEDLNKAVELSFSNLWANTELKL